MAGKAPSSAGSKRPFEPCASSEKADAAERARCRDERARYNERLLSKEEKAKRRAERLLRALEKEEKAKLPAVSKEEKAKRRTLEKETRQADQEWWTNLRALEKEEKAKLRAVEKEADDLPAVSKEEKAKLRAVEKEARQALRDFEWSEKAKLCTPRRIISQADAQDMASKVKATLAETDMMQKCIDSIASSRFDELRDHARIVRNYGTKWDKARVCFLDMEGNKNAQPYSISVAAEGLRRSWLMNPCSAGALATVDDIEARLGSIWIFDRVYRLIMGCSIPADQDRRAALQALHARVILLPTIPECAAQICQVLARFDLAVHWHGTDWHFLCSVGSKTPVMDLGKVFSRFFLPVRNSIKVFQVCELNQAVACLVMGGQWQEPHDSLHDALMLEGTFKGLSTLFAKHQVTWT